MTAEIADAKSNRADSYTQLKLNRAIRNRAKAAAQLLNEEMYEFVTIAIEERLATLKAAGRLTI